MAEALTVGELKRMLACHPEDARIECEGHLAISPIKQRGDDLVVVEFRQFQAALSGRFKAKHPTAQVVFCQEPEDGVAVVPTL